MASRLHSCREEAGNAFADRFHRPPNWLAAAPGRVNLIGEHTDYNDGFVLPMAIDRYVVAAGGSHDRGSAMARVYSLQMNQTVELPLQPPFEKHSVGWANYLQGVIAGWHGRGLDLPPLDAAIVSDVPPGGGLSSSAALEVAFVTLLEGISGHTLEPVDKVLLCQQAEHDFAGVPCGVMDQFSSTLCQADHLMLLDCRDLAYEMIPFDAGEVAVLIIDSRVRHELSDGEYARRRGECGDAARALQLASLREATLPQLAPLQESHHGLLFRRARHVVAENQRTLATAAACRAGDWRQVGRLMQESHASLRDDFEVSCPELDLLVEAAIEQDGVFGSRMTGGGFGGCTVTLVKTDRASAALEAVLAVYQNRTGIETDGFVSKAVGGGSLRRA